MPTGAWGARARELLEQRTEESGGASLGRAGGLAMLGAAPIVAGSWSCWLFGEPEDRGEFAARHGLLSRSDLAAAFAGALAELGEAACGLLCGRFVVVAVDRDRNRCVVTRDQLGVQPLIYAPVSGGVLFAEHEHELLALLPRTPSPDRLALLQWIDNGIVPKGRTLYEDLRRLPAGHQLILAGPDVSVERWWSPRFQGFERGSGPELAERLREAAFAAVGRAAFGAQRPAVKLSGGLDSACVAAGLSACSVPNGSAVAIGGSFATHPLADESGLIEATARSTSLPLELVAFDPSSSMLVPALAHIARWRLPPASPNLFLWQPLTARARELGVDLMLDGEGGDELFGLAAYLIADMLRAGRLPTAWSLAARIPGMGLHASRRVRMRVLRHYGLSPLVPAAVRRRRDARARAAQAGSILSRPDAQALSALRTAGERARRDGPWWWCMQVENMIDVCDLLDIAGHFRREAADERIDRRHPFLHDLPLIETVLRLPPRVQFDPLRDRPLLRDALRGLIPEDVRARFVKSHFTSLVLAGMRASESDLIDPLRRSDAPVRAYVAPAGLERALAVAADERPLLGAGMLWRLAIADRWLSAQTGEGI